MIYFFQDFIQQELLDYQMIVWKYEYTYKKKCSCGSVVEHCVSSAKVVGSIPREHILTKKNYNLNDCKSIG